MSIAKYCVHIDMHLHLCCIEHLRAEGPTLCCTQVIHVNYFSAVIDPVYFPHLEVIGDIGNAIWQLCERIKGSPPPWDTRWSALCAALPCVASQQLTMALRSHCSLAPFCSTFALHYPGSADVQDLRSCTVAHVLRQVAKSPV